jgi:hypothetical protein
LLLGAEVEVAIVEAVEVALEDLELGPANP